MLENPCFKQDCNLVIEQLISEISGKLTPLFVDSALALWALFRFRQSVILKYKMDRNISLLVYCMYVADRALECPWF